MVFRQCWRVKVSDFPTVRAQRTLHFVLQPWQSTLIHLRLPFSLFLLPIFLFGLFMHPADAAGAWAAFVIIHVLLYPASHAFNTWYDRDEQAIGLLKVPPPVHRSLIVTAWTLDAAALIASWFLGPLFFGAMVLYTLGSKLYSWRVTRWKKRPFAGWLGVGLVQGSLTYLAVVQGLGSPLPWDDVRVWGGAATAALFLWGVYPLTQVYQHEEDARHGDLTISRYVGIRGTFVLSGTLLAATMGAFTALFIPLRGWTVAAVLLVSQTPTLVYFLWWTWSVWKNESRADFRRTMGMNTLASGLMNLFFLAGLLWDLRN